MIKSTVFSLLAMSLAASVVAAQTCPRTADVREAVVVDTESVDGFGKYGRFPRLPLRSGQYILTFDDGPNWTVTPQILDILKRNCVPATFFMIGKHAQEAERIAKMVAQDGFGIGSHSFTHRTLTDLPMAEAEDDIRNGMMAVEKAVGGLPSGTGRLFRFPSNAYNHGLLTYVRSLRATSSFADLSPEDWRNSPPDESFVRFRNRMNTVDRGVIILHDNQPNTVLLLPMIITEVHSRGGHFVEMVAKGAKPALPLP